MDKNKRIEWIDYLKAFACFLVVLGHLLQSLYAAGIDKYFYITDKIDIIIYLFHMPLFMCLSGYLYCMKENKFNLNEYRKFELKKIINLSIPYFVFYVLFIALNVLASGNVNHKRSFSDLLNMFNSPMAPFWFLYALLSIFIIIPIIEKLSKYNKKTVFFTLSILKIISIFVETKIYFIDSIMQWAIYFYLGSCVQDVKEKSKSYNTISTVIYMILGILYSLYYSFIPDILNEIIRIAFSICGTFICISIFKNIKQSIILNTFKKYTFQIYLTHTIFAAAVRTFLFKIGINNYFIHLITGIFASIYIPVLMSIICEKTVYLNFFFYPIKTIKEIKLKKGIDLQ